MPSSSKKLKKLIIKDYQIPQSRLIGHQVLVATNLMMMIVILIELFFDLSATSLSLLIPSFLVNLILLIISFAKRSIKYLEIAHIMVLYLIVEIHFFVNPGVFHILVYWMPFLPMHALITKGMNNSKWWLLITTITILLNGYYGQEVIGNDYVIISNYIKFTSAGLLFLLCIYAGFYLLYYLLGDAYAKTKDKNDEIERLNSELQNLNESLEERVHERTHDLNEKNNRLERIAFMNSHEVRSSISKIISASDAMTMDEEKKEQLITVIVDSSKDLDEAIRAMNKEIEQN
ncbi:hypothetical protein [Ekhidna sp.]|uniref:hypothetical protein n=1 Tax=Ekhidna sp. TaxID=2608089 RepID=UPI003B50400A